MISTSEMIDPLTKISILSPLAMLQIHHHPRKSWIRRGIFYTRKPFFFTRKRNSLVLYQMKSQSNQRDSWKRNAKCEFVKTLMSESSGIQV
ncbi:hypothetical protein DICVIV_08472 [Dictyocaulus viviparus]|uniref:Uncharacterized protein n=1 Tax=Dictyocaulus viviparus TaxID=29172 RepID=A0A0D8XNT9_DICVI|nr:hypothetical protein DICVIV_08472 [Dictyocaulus viviparus]